MPRPFNVPDEFVDGFIKSMQSFWKAYDPNAAGFQVQLDRVARLQGDYLQKQFALWTRSLVGGVSEAPVVAPAPGDRRFSAAEWRESRLHDLLRQNYLLNASFVSDVADLADLPPKAKRRLRFYARQLVEMASPANFLATNPEAAKLAVDSQGETLRAGLANLLTDLKKGGFSITDESAFEVGKNVAASEGAVVFENEIFQLLQYAPLTAEVALRPLVIVPPCINKFYILDLQPENSFVRYATEQGHTVFVVSWRNPDASCDDLTWDDYVEKGAIAAIETALAIAGADKANAIGWCVGGTILSCALAVLEARGRDCVASLTLLTTLLDYEDPGELGVFIDEEGVVQREMTIGKGGLYSGKELAFVFQTLRGNDLIWPNVVNNYLKGRSPEAFDLLYWNADTTNLAGPMYTYYLRNMYLENNLQVPGRLTMCGVPVDLGRIDVPSYVLGTQEDHIVPWRSAFRSPRLLGGRSQFVLGASGHIAGVVNPASKKRRKFWSDGDLDGDADSWFASAKETPGSWWPHWARWAGAFKGGQAEARAKLGSPAFPTIEPAPGRYVKAKA